MRKLVLKYFGIILTCCTWVILLLSCQQDDPFNDLGIENDIYSDAPVFQFFDEGTGIDIKAGVNNFYMFTDYDTLLNNQIIFRSEFRKLESCVTDCAESLKFYFNSSNDAYTNGDILNYEAINVGELVFASEQSIEAGQVIIEYTGQNNITYRSDQLEQASESYFRVNSIADYLKNENSDPTKQLNIEFHGVLKSVTGEEMIAFTSATASIGVAYPE